MENKYRVLISNFKEEIERNRRFLFGLSLYQATSPTLIRWMQKSSFHRIYRRMESALKNAEELVEAVELNGAPIASLALFEFPHKGAAMNERVNICLDIYFEVFPERAKRPLNKEEAVILRNHILER